MEMKRYWLFGFDTYYPAGGMQDFEFSFDTLEDFEELREIKLERYPCDNYHVFDSSKGVVATREYLSYDELKDWVARLDKKALVQKAVKMCIEQNDELFKKLAKDSEDKRKNGQ